MENQLETFEKKFYLLLEKFKKEYVLYKSTDSKEYKNIFLNTENNINKLLKDIFLFKSQLLGETDTIDRKLTKQNNEIEKDRNLTKKLKNKIFSLQNIYNASLPMKKMSKERFNTTFLDLMLMVLMFIVLLFTSYKL